MPILRRTQIPRARQMLQMQLINQRDGSFGMPLAYTNQKNRPFGL